MSKRKGVTSISSISSKFEIKNQLGKGGNAEVYLVEDKDSEQEYALKWLYNKGEEKKQRFKDEINLVVDNCNEIPGMIPIIDYYKDDFWYTMPVAEPILNHIKDNEQNIRDIIKGIIQLSETLCELHSRGISHRDIKPSNIYFYDDRYCFGDFGLVELPDNTNNFTKSDKGLGAIFTIAPEMKRDPKSADGKKADVFSLAKTIWMLLTGNELGFDGVYDFLDKSYSLRFMQKFKNIHLVELEKLLTIATNNDPNSRPDINSFRNKLKEWLDISEDFKKSQISDWNFLNKYLFTSNAPDSSVWRNTEKIIDILNVIGTLPAYNHMLFSEGGGLDFSKAEKANEEGCIYIYTSIGDCSVIKPKCLYYESFENNYEWNYFLLEFGELSPIIDKSYISNQEYLVEDYPGHYVSADYAQYGVYDYNTGELFPQGYRVVTRYLSGKFLIVLNSGPYNKIPETYDGRHGLVDNDKFRYYMECLIKKVNEYKTKGFNEDIILKEGKFKNPFSSAQCDIIKDYSEETKYNRIEKENKLNLEKFIKENYNKWCFKDVLKKYSDNNRNIVFYIKFKLNESNNIGLSSLLSGFADKYLCNDGYIKNLEKESADKEIYSIYNRDEALKVYEQCINLIKNKYHEKNFELSEYECEDYFSIELKRIGKPNHLFTKSEIENVMRNADDRQNNRLVIDENGYAKVIQDTDKGYLYPVRHEQWDAGNMYVGKYSELSTLDEDYLASLQGWLSYLKTGRKVYMDYVHENKNIDNLIKEIKKYY